VKITLAVGGSSRVSRVLDAAMARPSNRTQFAQSNSRQRIKTMPQDNYDVVIRHLYGQRSWEVSPDVEFGRVESWSSRTVVAGS
jgi:hypothetical protein